MSTYKATEREIAAEEGDLRLARRTILGGSGFVAGYLQVYINGVFGAVCPTFFDDLDASVACRQLGFVGGLAPQDVLGLVDLERDTVRSIPGMPAD